MNRFGWLAVTCALAGMALVGCGDDGGGDDTMGGTDMGPLVTCADDPCEAVEICVDRTDAEGTVTGHSCVGCPADAPSADQQMPPCCFRVSNADRLDTPEFRVTNLQISAPEGALTSGAVLNILALAVEEERFNWLMRATVSGTDVTVETGYGEWTDATSTYNFVDGAAPTPGDVDRWNPITIDGTLSGDTFSAPPVPGSFTVPIFDESGENLDLELPLNSFEVISATFSEDRTCIGSRIADGAGYRNYETAGDVRTYITVADAEISNVTQLGTTLCNLISGDDCVEDETADWRNTPDALCDVDGNCTAGCDFAATGDCNAWEIRGQFAAAGVEIAD